ncbi:hypothetical protein EAKF1_ch4393 [Escherichia albertii KF1]|nr:hypothetical protein EAKF1_ch4393 [Escherichia albertii KF1]
MTERSVNGFVTAVVCVSQKMTRSSWCCQQLIKQKRRRRTFCVTGY